MLQVHENFLHREYSEARATLQSPKLFEDSQKPLEKTQQISKI